MRNETGRLSVTVIIPTYNRADFLREAIECCLDQTRPPDEILVIDDGSTDDTDLVLSNYGSPVKVLRQANQGGSMARNRGMKEATGDAVIYLDSDDLLTPRCIEQLVTVLEKKPEVDLSYPDAYLVDRDANRFGVHSEVMPGLRPSGRVLADLGRCCFLNMSGVMVRRSALKDAAFDSGLRCGEDYDFWRQLAGWCVFEYVDEPLMCYRYHDAQIVAERQVEILEVELEVQRRIMAMPQFKDFTPRQKAKIYCHHGAKNAILGHSKVAREMFRQAVSASPTYPVGYALLTLSLAGDRALQYAILRRRKYLGNHIDLKVGHEVIARQRLNGSSSVPQATTLVS